MKLLALDKSSLQATRDLLALALPHDRIDVVCAEKLFGDDGLRVGTVTGAYDGDRLVGLVAQAGRFIKILAVAADSRRRGIGTQLLDHAATIAKAPVRMGDHPGNYLSPGVDDRYVEGLAFCAQRGFVERGRVENLRVPYAGNTLVSAPRKNKMVADLGVVGYRIARPTAVELPVVMALIAQSFAPVWASEAARAYAGPRRALFVAFANEAPVGFAAADGNNQGLGWFGPAGTLPAHRGKHLGEALLLECLLAVEGLPEAGVIAWIGPKAFYEKACAAVEDRKFVQMERPA